MALWTGSTEHGARVYGPSLHESRSNQDGGLGFYEIEGLFSI
jgi:hypothetical protein